MKSIINRRNLDMKFEASIHGMEMKESTDSAGEIELDEDKEKAIEQAQLEAQKRVRKRINGS